MEKKVESEENLYKYNTRKALSHLLAIEEHLREIGENDISCNTWCTKKHYLLCDEHHMDEALSHAPKHMKEPLRAIRRKIKDWYENSSELEERIAGIRDLRNEFRQVINDETLGVECEDGVCHHDQLSIEKDEKKKNTDGDLFTSITEEAEKISEKVISRRLGNS